MISARFFEERGNNRAGFRASQVNLWVRLIVGRNRLDEVEGANDGRLLGADADPLAIARAVGLLEELGRKGAEDFVTEGLKDADRHGLLLVGDDGITIGDWDVWGTSAEDENRRRREREKKRRQRARSADVPPAVPGGQGGGQTNVSPLLSPRDVPGDTGEIEGVPGDVPGGPATDRVDPVDPVDPQDPTPTPPKGPRGGLTVEGKLEIAALVEPPDPKPSMRMGDRWWKELRSKAALPNFSKAVTFIRWYGQLLFDEKLARSAAPHQRICSPSGVRSLRKLFERLDEDYNGDWDSFRADLWDGARGLVNDKNAREGGYLELDKHLLRDTAQFERHRRSGERLKRGQSTKGGPSKDHSGGNIAGNWSQETPTMKWANKP